MVGWFVGAATIGLILGFVAYVYYTAKLAATDKLTFQELAALMTGMGREEYRDMMVNGGRGIDGNRSKSEWT